MEMFEHHLPTKALFLMQVQGQAEVRRAGAQPGPISTCSPSFPRIRIPALPPHAPSLPDSTYLPSQGESDNTL